MQKIMAWKRDECGFYCLLLKVPNGVAPRWVSTGDGNLDGTIFELDTVTNKFKSALIANFFKSPAKSKRAKDDHNCYPDETLTLPTLLRQVQLRYAEPLLRPCDTLQLGMKTEKNWLPPGVHSTDTAKVQWHDGKTCGFAGHRLVANRYIKKDEVVAIINLLPKPPCIRSWSDAVVKVGKDLWSCAPPTPDHVGVLMNAAFESQQKNCCFIAANKSRKTMNIKATKNIAKATELLCNQYMGQFALKNKPVGKLGKQTSRQKNSKTLFRVAGKFASKK